LLIKIQIIHHQSKKFAHGPRENPMKVRLRVKIEFQGEKSEVLFAKIKQKKKVNNQLKKKQKCPLCGWFIYTLFISASNFVS
jgi:hypothetical protein